MSCTDEPCHVCGRPVRIIRPSPPYYTVPSLPGVREPVVVVGCDLDHTTVRTADVPVASLFAYDPSKPPPGVTEIATTLSNGPLVVPLEIRRPLPRIGK